MCKFWREQSCRAQSLFKLTLGALKRSKEYLIPLQKELVLQYGPPILAVLNTTKTKKESK